MKIIEQRYWSVQQTQDGKSWYEIFQLNDFDEDLTEEDAFHLATLTKDVIKESPQFFRVKRETKEVLTTQTHIY